MLFLLRKRAVFTYLLVKQFKLSQQYQELSLTVPSNIEQFDYITTLLGSKN